MSTEEVRAQDAPAHDAPLTIGMFTDTYVPEVNGVVTSLVSTARALRRRGHRVIIVGPAHPEGDEEHPDVFHLRSTAFPFYPSLRMAFPLPAKLVTALPSVPFDVVHAHTFFFIGCLGAYLARRRGVPLFFTYHTRFEDYLHYLPVHRQISRPQTVWLSREFCNRCDRVIAPTRDTAELLRSYGVTAPFAVLPGGIDREEFGGTQPEPAVIAQARPGPVALFVGRLGQEKNLDFLLEGFARAVRAVPGARLVIVGDGPYRAHLTERVAALGCEGCVFFAGRVAQRDLGAFYANADVFVFSSLTETQGLVLVEAMAHGLPVVAVDCAVTREIVAGEAGVLVPADPDAFAAAILRVVTESAGHRERRRLAAREAAEPFSIDAVARSLEALYRQARHELAAAGI
jgi:1,2-diacylglycerol 3-alpha-glucosyltransferase